MSLDETDLLNRRAQRLGALLREADPPVPPIAFPAERIARAARRRTVVRWRVAAAIALLALASVGVRPVRAWIVQAARALWAAAAGGAPRAAVVRPAAVDGGPSTVTFTPTGRSFVLRVEAPQAGGTLTVEATSGVTASAAVAGGGSGAELVVLPYGLRIVNDSGSTASYAVRLPASLARIEVGVGSAAPRILSPARPGARWVLDLKAVP